MRSSRPRGPRRGRGPHGTAARRLTTARPGDPVIFSLRPQRGHCLYCSIGRSIVCDGINHTTRYMLFDVTTRMSHRGEGLNQLARIGTIAEKVVCPAEQLVAIRKD